MKDLDNEMVQFNHSDAAVSETPQWSPIVLIITIIKCIYGVSGPMKPHGKYIPLSKIFHHWIENAHDAVALHYLI